MATDELFRTALGKLAALPASENPYLYASGMLDSMVYPKIHPVVFGLLILFAVIHATVIVCSMSIIIIPFRSGKEGRRKNLWLYHRRYVNEYESPYYLPNSSMGVAITQLCTSACFVTFIFLAYHSYHSPSFQRSCYLLMWYGFSYLPGYIGLYVTAWNACLTCLTFRGRDGRVQALCRYFPPRVLNVVMLTIPLAVTVFSIFICVLIGVAIHDFNKSYETLRNNLELASASWAGQKNGVNLGVLMMNLQSFGYAVDHLSRSCRYSTAGWIFWVMLLLFCYAIAVSSLLRLLKQCVASSSNAASEIGTCFPNQPSQSQSGEEGSVQPIEEDHITHWTIIPAARANELRLKKCFNYMVRHCAFMFLAILYDLSVTIVMHHASFHLTNASWRSISLVVSLVSAMLIAPAMLFQAWRTFTERDCLQYRPSNKTLDPKPTLKCTPSTKTKQSPCISERVSRAILGDPKMCLPPAKQICVEQVTTQWTEDPHGAHEEVEEIQIVLQGHKIPCASSEP